MHKEQKGLLAFVQMIPTVLTTLVTEIGNGWMKKRKRKSSKNQKMMVNFGSPSKISITNLERSPFAS